MNLIEISRLLVGVDSSPSNGTFDLCQRVLDLAKKEGFDCELQEEILNGHPQANIYLRHPQNKSTEPQLLLLTHLDTSDPGTYAHWSQNMGNPYSATIHNEYMYGLGVAGAKLDFLCKMVAAKKFLNSKLKRPLVVCGTYGEQSGMAGAIKMFRRKKVQTKWALVGEPTQFQIINAASGYTEIEIEVPFSEEEKSFQASHDVNENISSQSKIFTGKAVLATHPMLGQNAIVKMLEHLMQLPDGIGVLEMDGGTSPHTVPANAYLEFDLGGGFADSIQSRITKVLKLLQELEVEFQQQKASGFEPDVSTFNIGKVRTTKDGVVLSGCCRILPVVTDQQVEVWMNRLKGACEEVGAIFKITSNKKPFHTSEKGELSNLCQSTLSSLGLKSNFIKTTTCTEANVLSHFGVECLVWGPGQGVGNTHQPNERIKISDLEAAVNFYTTVIEKFCL